MSKSSDIVTINTTVRKENKVGRWRCLIYLANKDWYHGVKPSQRRIIMNIKILKKTPFLIKNNTSTNTKLYLHDKQ